MTPARKKDDPSPPSSPPKKIPSLVSRIAAQGRSFAAGVFTAFITGISAYFLSRPAPVYSIPTPRFLPFEHIPRDAESVQKLKEAAEWPTDYAARCTYAFYLQQTDHETSRTEMVIEMYGEALNNKYWHASTLLGYAYSQGYGVTEDLTKAASYYKLAADHGDLCAKFLLAQVYAKGSGVAKDARKARKLVKEAAESGHRYSIVWYAQICMERPEEDDNLTAIMDTVRTLSREGFAAASLFLAQYYLRSDSTKPDYTQVHSLLQSVSSSGECKYSPGIETWLQSVLEEFHAIAANELDSSKQRRLMTYLYRLGHPPALQWCESHPSPS
jgi:TPR repeat protein